MTQADHARPIAPLLAAAPAAPAAQAAAIAVHPAATAPPDPRPTGAIAAAPIPADPAAPAVTVGAFLASVAAVLQGGLPRQVWIEATIVAVKPGPYGHTIELVDPTPAPNPPHLRVFLPKAERTGIDRQFGFAVEPTLLVGLTTCLLVAPRFDPKWHLGGRVVGLARSAATSLRQRLLDEAIATLKRERLFDRQRTLAAPRDVTRIAVVHPPGSAGMADIAGVLSRWRAADLVVVQAIATPFEGDSAARGLVEAVRQASQPIEGHSPDLLLIVRGGGARAGLLVCDDLAVARAVCLSPVPVVTGIGHAIDESLVDRVAWRSVATPSMAVGLVATLMAAITRAAGADHQAILTQAGRQLAAAALALAGTRERIDAGLEQQLSKAAAALAACWSAVLVDVTRRRGEAARRADALDQRLREILAAAPLRLGREAERLRRTVTDALDRAWRGLGRHDGGLAGLTAVGHAARAGLDRQRVATDALQDAVLREVRRLTLDAEACLAGLAVVVESSDLAAVLRRGFALVTDVAGRLLPTRATAVPEQRLVLVFADGTLDVVPVGPPALKPGDGAGGTEARADQR